MHFRLDNKGVSLIGILAIAILLGLIIVGVMKIFEAQTKSQKDNESGFEITSASQLIDVVLNDNQSCQQTLGIGNTVSNSLSISAIKDHEGADVFNTTDKYGNNLIKLESIGLQEVIFESTADTTRDGTANLNIVFKKLNKVIRKRDGTEKEVTKTFPLIVKVDASNDLINCYSASKNIVATVKKEICQSLGGTHDATTDGCTLECPGGQFLSAVAAGGSMKCIDLTCDDDKFFRGMSSDGRPICANIGG